MIPEHAEEIKGSDGSTEPSPIARDLFRAVGRIEQNVSHLSQIKASRIQVTGWSSVAVHLVLTSLSLLLLLVFIASAAAFYLHIQSRLGDIEGDIELASVRIQILETEKKAREISNDG